MIDIKKLKLLTNELSVLYVEDDSAIQSTMHRYLQKLFKDVTIACNGEDGLREFKTKHFDIVITDLSMPKMDGIEMIKQMREVNEAQPILITTAHGESKYLMDAIKAHIDGYILKPFDYEALNFELYKLSEKIKKFQENENYKEHLQEILNLQTYEMNENYEKTIYSMIELIEQRDTYTAGHSKRVAYYCKIIAKNMGYSDEECTLLHQAAILHDVGKIETPDAVLLNPNKLNDIEYKLIQEHVTVGYKLLDNIPMFKPLANIVYAHHERYDGKGYPNGLKGDEIDELARIMIVADAFDAMTTNRIYKARKGIPEAVEELKSLSKKQFHPEVIESAAVVLKDVVIDDNINQLPKTKLEKERFAYFYNDTLSQAYNQNYLDVVLIKNSYDAKFKKMAIFLIHNFSQYNKEHGWEAGDKFLKEFADTLCIHLDESLVFRVFGDDFVIMSHDDINLEGVKKVLGKLIENSPIFYTIKHIDLDSKKIERLSDIEIHAK
jgi:putative nucleotidyltransferase with HDIG domain